MCVVVLLLLSGNYRECKQQQLPHHTNTPQLLLMLGTMMMLCWGPAWREERTWLRAWTWLSFAIRKNVVAYRRLCYRDRRHRFRIPWIPPLPDMSSSSNLSVNRPARIRECANWGPSTESGPGIFCNLYPFLHGLQTCYNTPVIRDYCN